jgi:dUTP pyrophosphatase
MKVKIKRLSKTAVIPKYAKKGDAGMDLTATRIKRIGLFRIQYFFDICLQPDKFENVFFDLRPRSSVHKTKMWLSNSVGTGDQFYTGEYSAIFYCIPFISKPYKVGDRVIQLITRRFEAVEFTEVEELESTERGAGGYGSTGK